MLNEFTALTPPECDMLLKIIIIGDSGVGKSAILKCYMGDPFQSAYTSTIGVDFEIKPIVLDGKTINLQVWDTAGQERFRTITTSYYRSSNGIILTFDITNEQSFAHLDHWLDDIRAYAKSNVEIMLIGNKIDLEDRRVISYRVAKEYADKNGMQYMESSAKQNINVEMAFTRLTITAVSNQKILASGNKGRSTHSEGKKQSRKLSESVPLSSSNSSCCY